MNHPDDDYFPEDLGTTETQHQEQLANTFMAGIAIGIIVGGLLVFLVSLIL